MNIYQEKSDVASTLTTYLYCNFWQMWAAEKLGHTSYINWPSHPNRSLAPYRDMAKFAEIPNMYDWYFEQPMWPVGVVPPRDATWEWEHCKETGDNPFMSEPLAVIKAYYQKHLKFNPVVNARGQALVAKYGLDFQKTIGVSWRGTDCVTDGRPYLPISVYFPFIDEILAKEPGLRIMATAEETTVLEPLLARYPSAFTLSEFYSSPKGSLQNPERFSPFSGFERGMQPALMVWLFSKCAHYIKNRSSTGAVASWLSTGRIVSIAHRETLDYTQMPREAEVEGRIVPLQF